MAPTAPEASQPATAATGAGAAQAALEADVPEAAPAPCLAPEADADGPSERPGVTETVEAAGSPSSSEQMPPLGDGVAEESLSTLVDAAPEPVER